MVTTRISKAVSIAAIVGLVSMSLGEDDRAQRYMLRYLQGDYKANIVAVLTHKSEDQGKSVVKIQRSKDGKIRQTILSPLHMQCEILEDGKVRKTYLADDRKIIIQPSNSVTVEASFRIPLVQKNYTLKSEKGKSIAGRRCVLVTATSKFNQVPSLRYQFDEATGFPMQMETVLPSGDVINGFEISKIEFPGKFDESVFRIDPVAGVEVIKYTEEKGLEKLSDAAPKLGFNPIAPAKIPFGFQIQKIAVASEQGVKTLCVVLNDGLQKATVFEWRYVPGEDVRTGEASSSLIIKGIKVTVLSDFGSDLRQAFLRPFVARTDRESPAILTSVGF